MLRRVVWAAIILPIAALHGACSATPKLPADDPYARCVDLGEISLLSDSSSDAQQRMRVRVRELGGDTLLFGVRGRSRRLADAPEEIVQRRSELLAPAETAAEEVPAAAAPPDRIEDAEEPELTEATGDRRSTSRISVTQTQELPGELWYYGAALRCNASE